MGDASDHKNQPGSNPGPSKIRQLHSAATALQRQSGIDNPPFCLAAMTEARGGPDPAPLIRALPRGSALIFRHYFAPERVLIAQSLCTLARRHGVGFIVAGDVALADRVQADGVHLPAWLLPRPGQWRHARGVITAACHNQHDLQLAKRYGVDMALVSPVWPTRSHPGARALGPAGLKALAREAAMPVLALGGIDSTNAARLQGRNIVGLAAISAFHPPLRK